MSIHYLKGKTIQFLKIGFPLILLVLAVIEIRKFAMELDIQLLKAEISQIEITKLIIVLLITVGAIFPMFFYDVTIVKILKIPIRKKKLLKQSLIVNSFSNLIGFGGLIGVVLRTYFYRSKEMSGSPNFHFSARRLPLKSIYTDSFSIISKA